MPNVGVTSIGEKLSPSWEGVAPPSLLLRTHAPIPLASPFLQLSPRSRSLCRLRPAPAANGIFPTLSLRIFPRMLGSLPRRYRRLHLPVSSPASSAFPRYQIRSASRDSPLKRLPSGDNFRGCRHSFIVTGHGAFLRRSHGSSRRDLSNCSASEVHRDVKEWDRILTCVGTGSIPERGKAS